MASRDSGSPERRRLNNHTKRDQPLFASRRPGPTLQQPPEFLTDSLNTTYIPSPSPSKSSTRQAIHPRPRQLLDRKTLAASFNSLAKQNKENESPQNGSRSQSTKLRSPQHRSPLRDNGGKRSSTPTSNTKSARNTRTPTPPRGRQDSFESPNSPSSPPRGYAEAYQRIVEEENLASEDSIDLGLEDIDDSHADLSQEGDNLRQQSDYRSLSPKSLRNSRRPSPRLAKATVLTLQEYDMAEREADHSEVVSNPGQLEDATKSSTGSGSSQYARDLQRLNAALTNSNKPFSKARLGERIGKTTDGLRRRTGSNESLGSAYSSGSLSNRTSDPSINIPKAWGRKAKPGNEWMNRIHSRNLRHTNKASPDQSGRENRISEEGNLALGKEDCDWIAAASETPLPDSSSVKESSQGSTPRTAIHQQSPVENTTDWTFQDDDFTGRSIQVSESPPIQLRRNYMDRARDDEIEKLEKRGVTKSRLGEFRERASSGSLNQKGSSDSLQERAHPLADTATARTKSRLHRGSLKSNSLGDSEADEAKSPLPDTGEAIPDTPIVVYKSDQGRHTSNGRGGPGRQQQPKTEQGESDGLLRRLARATSDSPSPQHSLNLTDHPREETLNGDGTIQNAELSTVQKTPIVTGAWVDQTLEPEQTPATDLPKTDFKTPRVTGAWVGTPFPADRTESQKDKLTDGNKNKSEGADRKAPTSGHSLKSEESAQPNIQNQKPLPYTGPPLPRSALEEIVNEAKLGNGIKAIRGNDSEDEQTLQLGNSTIQSLEDLIENDTDYSTLLAPTPPSQETSPPSTDPSPSKSDPPRSKTAEDVNSYSKLLSRLTNLGPSLRASKRQLASLERSVSDQSGKALSRRPQQTDTDVCNEAGEFHDFIWPCQRCGCPGGMSNTDDSPMPSLLTIRNHVENSVMTLSVPIPRLWRWRRKDWRPRLTWLGVFVFSVYCYFFAEFWAQDIYCHKEFATSMVGYGVDINAPEPPFVLFKVLYRASSLSTILDPLYILTRTIVRLAAALAGYVIGYINEGSQSPSPSIAPPPLNQPVPVSRDTRIPRPNWGPDLSMLDDEYL